MGRSENCANLNILSFTPIIDYKFNEKITNFFVLMITAYLFIVII